MGKKSNQTMTPHNRVDVNNKDLLLKRLKIWLKADSNHKKYQFIRTLSFTTLIFTSSSIVITSIIHQITPAWVFISVLTLLLISILTLLWVIPLVPICLAHRIALSQRFFSDDLHIEFSDEAVFIRNRRNYQIIYKMSR